MVNKLNLQLIKVVLLINVQRMLRIAYLYRTNIIIISLILIAIPHIHHQSILINEHDNQDSAHQ